MATLLSAHDVATQGGETEFASTYAAYDHLTDEEQERFLGVRVVHTLEATQRLVNPDPTPEEVAVWRQRPPKEHPLVWTHLSGRRSLVLGATTESVVGMAPAEGRGSSTTCSTGPRRPSTSTATSGPSATSSSGTTPASSTGHSPTTPPPRDMHRTTLYGQEAVQ